MSNYLAYASSRDPKHPLMYQHINISIYQHINISTHQYINTSIYQHLYQHINISTPISTHQCINTSMYQHINVSTHQYLNTSIYGHINVYQCPLLLCFAIHYEARQTYQSVSCYWRSQLLCCQNSLRGVLARELFALCHAIAFSNQVKCGCSIPLSAVSALFVRYMHISTWVSSTSRSAALSVVCALMLYNIQKCIGCIS